MKLLFYENHNRKITTRRDQPELGDIPHLHAQIEIILLTAGEAYASADDKTVRLEAGDLFIVFPNQVHKYKGLPGHRYSIVVFSPELCPEFTHVFSSKIAAQPVARRFTDVGEGINAFDKLLDLVPADKDGKSVPVRAYLMLLMDAVLSRIRLTESDRRNTNTLRDILNFIAANFREPLTLDSLAGALHINKYHISHLFGEKLGMGVAEYINLRRVDAACEELKKTDKKVTEIALSAGFNSPRSLNRAFKKVMGKTPLEYKREAL